MDAFRESMNILWNFIQTLGFWDILDIVIVSYLIYRLLTFVRKTSTGSVVKGIVLLLAVMWLSSILQLNVIGYLLGKTMQFGILAIIVLFQPELRRFLEQMGSKQFMGIFGRKINKHVIESTITQIVLACKEMSATKTGALIVFERENRLDDYIKTGTIVNAEPTAELVKSIFFPKSPLHDGAIIIRGGTLSGAGCMLPLSNNTNLNRNLGMRHRAGIGMSERSDAVVVIVSEETGLISVAIEGMLKRNLMSETFEKILRKELISEDKPENQESKKKLKNIFKVKNDDKGNNK